MNKPTLMPPNSSGLDHKLSQVCSRIEDIPVPLRDLWNPNTCPAELLPWLAWTLSLDSWKEYWPESIKRARCREAITIQRRKGTLRSVKDVVASFGGDIVIREWWQKTPQGRPHTFDVLINVNNMGGQAVSAEFVQDIIDEISRTKPVRSHFEVQQGLSSSGQLVLAGAARAAVFNRLTLVEA